MKLLSQEQRQEIRDLCRVIVRRNVELSADKVLQQLKSEYCCPEGRAPLPDVWTAHNIEIKTKMLDSNNYNCFYCTSKNTAIHYTLDPVRSLSKQPNTVQQYNKEKTGLGPARQSAPLQALTRLSILDPGQPAKHESVSPTTTHNRYIQLLRTVRLKLMLPYG